MVVLEGSAMLSSSVNQYLQPDYLSPLPTTLDAKKSPLALLAQTCSQIGADSPTSKPLISQLDKPRKTASSNNGAQDLTRSSPNMRSNDKQADKPRTSPFEPTKLGFKPYELNVVSNVKKSEDTLSSRPSSKAANTPGESCGDDKKLDSPHRKSVSPTSGTQSPMENGTASPNDRITVTPTARSASPIIRSGLEILQGQTKENPLSAAYKPLSASAASLGALNSLSSLCCPPGLEQHTNPAFRPPFPGAPFSHHMLGYPGASGTPFLSYARVKTASGGETLVPVCKDPYCTGCQFSLHNQQMLLGGGAACPSGCTQCDHQKYNLAMAMSLLPPGTLPSSLAYSQLGRPYVCNWIAGESYCGKRFVTSDELLQHLRTHTNSSDVATSVSSTASSLLNPLFSASALHRAGYPPNGPLSPLSAARYHPYAKPTLPGSLAGSPYSAFNPTSLGHYYSPYAMYGQRIGAAAVHP